MKWRFTFPALLALIVVLIEGCSSGKAAYKQGDYYEAVLTAVQRLRQKPDHKKSREVLKLSYQQAVDYLESDAKNQIEANANFKWRSAVQDYEKINRLYEEIRTSPGALKVIPKPISKYNELTELKGKAAEETYEAGIQAMMKDSRDDAKRAYFLFEEANGFSPGYREAIEMMDQAKFNATLKVVVEPMIQNMYDWNFDPVMFGYQGNMFVKFYTPRQAQEEGLEKIDHFTKLIVNGYSEGRPAITKKVESFKDSVKTGEKTVSGKKVPVYTNVTAQMTTYTKTVKARGSVTLLVVDASSRAELRNTEIAADESWSDTWATCTGDQRALSAANKKLCEKREPYMERDYLQKQTKRELDKKLANAISSFYSRY